MSIFEFALRAYLKMNRLSHFVPFVDSIANMGRPCKNDFPEELLEQGIAVVLSGLNNTIAIQTNQNWLWPYWVERQIDPSTPAFIPTGLNIIKTNLSHRNWTSFGVLGSTHEAMLDPVGMLTNTRFGWSVVPYLRIAEKNYFPQKMHEKVQQQMQKFSSQLETIYQTDENLDWKFQVSPLSLTNNDAFLGTVIIKNNQPQTIKITLGLSLRPYNPLTISHIQHLEYDNDLFTINDKPAVLLSHSPQRIALANRTQGDPMYSNNKTWTTHPILSVSGIATGLAEFDITLDCSQSYEISFLLFSEKINKSFLQLERKKQFEIANNFKNIEQSAWENIASQGLYIKVPDVALDKLFATVKSHLMVFDDVDYFSPGTFLYHNHWFRDSVFLAMGFTNLGFTETVRKKIYRYPKMQTWRGFFRSQNGEWDSNGQAIFTITTFAKKTNDLSLVKHCYPAIKKAAHWIMRMRKSTQKENSWHAGLFPAGFSAEHFGANDHYFWDNFWSLAGLRESAWAARILGKTQDAQIFTQWFKEFELVVQTKITETLQRTNGDVLAVSPYRWIDSACIGNLVAVSPLGLVSCEEPWVKATVDYLFDNHLQNSLFFQKIFHTGMNPYLTAQLARVLMDMGDKRAFVLIKAMQEHATSTGTWPEAIHPKTKGGCMGDGDHGWSAAEFCNLMRDVLVREKEDSLLLADGVPIAWLKQESPIFLNNALTTFGTMDFELLATNDECKLIWKFIPQSNSSNTKLFLSLPSSFFEKVPTYGVQQGARIYLPLPAESGIISFLRGE